MESGDVDETAIRGAWEKNGLGKLTVPDLKGFLAGKGLGTSGKKQELIERVEEFFEMK